MSFYKIVTYGCQMNAHESEKLSAICESLGMVETQDTEQASLIVFNTCCVRENAEERVFGNVGALKKLKASKPALVIAVCGCMMQQKGKSEELIKRYPFIDIIFGTHNTEHFATFLKEKYAGAKRVVEVLDSEMEICEDIGYKRANKVHAYVNIMYGCNNYCTYCIVPYVRGRERSRRREAILDEIKGLLAKGYREITLLGQNVNSYGHDLAGECGFATLLAEIGALPGKFRVRFMTSHPKDLTQEVVDVMVRYPNICQCIHLPVQSGSNEVLRRMNRKYTREDFIARVKMIRMALENVAITTDLMIGFPAETEQDFEDTLDLVREIRFTNAFTFVYSIRKGTAAALYLDQIPEDVKKERITALVALQNQITAEISQGYLGQTCEVLIDGIDERHSARVCGRTESGHLVSVLGNEKLLGQFVQVRITKAGAASLSGEIVEL